MPIIMTDSLVLVTGASGYIATHVVKKLQEAGYRVRGTVRSLKDETKIKHLRHLCPEAKHKIELVEADLLNADSWTAAVKGCQFIHHVASPFLLVEPKHESELIKPAVDGTLNVLRAASDAGTVQRVVLTSSVVAIAVQGGNTKPFTEENWADDNKEIKLGAYAKSKMLAERAAWDFIKNLPDEKKLDLAVVNPTLVVGPALHSNAGSSTEIIKKLMERDFPRCPKFNFCVVDVRDVAAAHLQCMILDEAKGHRHILSSGALWMSEIAKILDKEFRSQGYNIPVGELPDFMVTIAGIFDKSIRTGKALASKVLLLDNSRMKDVLKISPVPIEQTFTDMGYTLVENGFVKRTAKFHSRPIS